MDIRFGDTPMELSKTDHIFGKSVKSYMVEKISINIFDHDKSQEKKQKKVGVAKTANPNLGILLRFLTKWRIFQRIK